MATARSQFTMTGTGTVSRTILLTLAKCTWPNGLHGIPTETGNTFHLHSGVGGFTLVVARRVVAVLVLSFCYVSRSDWLLALHSRESQSRNYCGVQDEIPQRRQSEALDNAPVQVGCRVGVSLLTCWIC